MKSRNKSELESLVKKTVFFIVVMAVIMSVIIIHKAHHIEPTRTEKTN